MNKEILSTINESSALFMQEERTGNEICQHIVNTLPAVLEVDNHPSVEEEEQGKGDCTTAYKYFRESALYSLPDVKIVPRIVERSIWEPMGKTANIHMIAGISEDNKEYQVDATHFIGTGYGQVHSEFNLHTTQVLTERDMQIIDRFKYIKHLYAHNLPEADYEAGQVLSLGMPRYMDSWRADLELIRINNLLERGESTDTVLDKLRLVTDLNPYKAGILRTIARLSVPAVESERFNGIRVLVEDNMKELQQVALYSSSEFFASAMEQFGNNDIKKGLRHLRLAWWVGNIAEPKAVPTVALDGQSISVTKLNPMEFRKHGLISIWSNKDVRLPENTDILLREDINLQLKQPYGYKPVELADVSWNLDQDLTKLTVMIVRPHQRVDTAIFVNGNQNIYSADTGARGVLNSIGILYPYLTNVDRFSVRSYDLLEKVNE